MAVQTPKGVVRLEDLCRPRRSRANVKTNGRAFHKPFEVAYREIAELRNFRRLEHLFLAADVDRSGEMSLDEFRQALRKPWFQRSFSLLGVQPHQAEVVFKKMNTANAEEISISDFMQGLENLLGTDLDGPPRDLDVSLLSSRFKAKTKLTPSRSEPLLHTDTLDRSAAAAITGPGQGKHISAALAVLSPTSSVSKKATRNRTSSQQGTATGMDCQDAPNLKNSATTDGGSPLTTERRQVGYA
ncbi:unnamed protein product [Symbiodinium pilosum]|uniref:EF-hand domain-containing protein n=1 Tax=Symbiodinium pilosum TaxID=2952 RepID=A0A812YAV9_SYMPI|nr:unnamed protein product [Symbiodinium pilosum]